MPQILKAAVTAAALIALYTVASAKTISPEAPYIHAAIADPARPAADKERDVNRKPAEMLAFAGIEPGTIVVDFIPGGGYFTRIFSKAVGAKGHVYAWQPSEVDAFIKKTPPVRAIAADKNYANVSVIDAPIALFAVPEYADVIWTSQNYHDMHDKFMGPADLTRVNKAVFMSLKPGGIYLVLDHAAEAGSGLRDTETLHRIDPAVVRKEVEAAGFKLEAESDVLRNPADDHSKKIFDPAIRGKTDQFIFKFRKPAR